jgi:uncharacterized lipoprotein YajG
MLCLFYLELDMKKLMAMLLVLVSLNILAGCEVIQEIVPGTEVAINNKDASWFAHWLDHSLNGHDDDD